MKKKILKMKKITKKNYHRKRENFIMSRDNLIKIYNLINDELETAPNEEQLSDKENEMYADMQNLKESLGEYFVDKIIEEQNRIKYTERKLIGLNKYLYVFNNEKDFKNAYKVLEKRGQVAEVFINNAFGIEFKENIRIFDEKPIFSEESKRSIEEKLSYLYGVETTIGDENISQIKNEMGDLGVELYEKYYDLYKENGMNEIYDFIDSFCYGNTTEIKQYYKGNKEIDKNEKINLIKEINADKKRILKYEEQRENLQLE